MYELFKLMKDFFEKNKSLVITSVIFQALYSIMEAIVKPFLLAGTFNSISNSEVFKQHIIKLIGLWIIVKLIGSLSLYYHNKIEPEISKYVILRVIESVFVKYENDNHITNISLIIDKLHLIRNNLHDVMFITCTVFLPRIIVLFVSCVTFLSINRKLGITIIACIILQYIILTSGLDKCVTTTYSEHTNKDKMYEYIEDIFSNIDIVQSTTNGYEFEMEKLHNLTESVKRRENKTTSCINTKQYVGYASNIAIFSFIFYTIYNLYKDGSLSHDQTVTVILLVIGLFENISDMTYYIPEFTHRFGVLKSNDEFLKDLLLKSDKVKFNLPKLDSSNIKFKNVSFKYPSNVGNNYILKDLNIEIPKNKIISIIGKSGSGKTTFIKLIFGTEKPINGNVMLGDKNIDDYNIKDIRTFISYINQDTSSLFNRSIFENISYGKQYSDSECSDCIEHIKEIFEEFGLYDIFSNLDKGREKWSFLQQGVGKMGEKLSGGQKKIVHLLRLELDDNSKIIILDEPTSSVDNKTRNNIINFIRYLNSKGKTLVIITHDQHFIDVSDRVLEFSGNENPRYTK